VRWAILLAALCAVLFVSNAEARKFDPRLQSAEQIKLPSNVGCSDPVMRPCEGSVIPASFFGEEINRKSLRHGHLLRASREKEIIYHNTTRPMPPGLRRVMADGAGRVVNWTKPRAWCGWQMRVWLGVANPAGNLARWWAGYGRDAHGPHVGAIVVWPRGRRHGHVGIITGRTTDGRWIVKSGNDGHRVRERPRSVAGAIAFRWPV
jgi:hypothetical protein